MKPSKDRHNLTNLLDNVAQMIDRKNGVTAGAALFYLIPETVIGNIAMNYDGAGCAEKFQRT